MAMDGGSSATLYLMGNIANSPSTLSHKDCYLTKFMDYCWKAKARNSHYIRW